MKKREEVSLFQIPSAVIRLPVLLLKAKVRQVEQHPIFLQGEELPTAQSVNAYQMHPKGNLAMPTMVQMFMQVTVQQQNTNFSVGQTYALPSENFLVVTARYALSMTAQDL
ncbi:hypothetical protein KCQ_04811 [Pectobacterium atrosepticum ICMP 1526]|nr:hypothetical protein KCQ_04811 [Pectobacterium atrosepticum ICMP 1526]